MKTGFIAILIATLTFLSHTGNAQTNNTSGRGVEFFPYPFKNIFFVSPRYDRQNLKYGNYFDTYTLRSVGTFGKNYHVRLDLPLANTNTTGSNTFGLSDVSIRLTHSPFSSGRLYFAYSLQAVFPTATKPELGSGKWQLRPGVGLAYFKGEGDRVTGTYIFALEYRFSYAGNSARTPVRVLAISPNIDWWFKKWYVGYYATWTYNFDNDVFDLPLDVEVGVNLLPSLVLSGEFILPLLADKTYNNEFAIKLRYSF